MTTIATTTTTTSSGAEPTMTPSPLSKRTTSPMVDAYAKERIQDHLQYNINTTSPLRERYTEMEPNASSTAITRHSASTLASSALCSPNIIRQSMSSHPTLSCSTRLFFPAGGIQHRSLPNTQTQLGMKDSIQHYSAQPPMTHTDGQRTSPLNAFCQSNDGVHGGHVPMPNFHSISGRTHSLLSGPMGRGSGSAYSAVHGRANDINHRLRTWSLVEDSFYTALNPPPSSPATPFFSAAPGGREEGGKGGSFPPPIDISPYGKSGGILPAPIDVAQYGPLKKPKDEPPDSDLISIPSPFLKNSNTPPTLEINMTSMRQNMTSISPNMTQPSPNMSTLRLDMPVRPDITPICRSSATHTNVAHRSTDGLNHTTITTFSPMFTVAHPYGGSYTTGTPHSDNSEKTQLPSNPATTSTMPSSNNNNTIDQHEDEREEEIEDVGEEEEDWTGRREDEQIFGEEDDGKGEGQGEQRRRRAKRTYVYNPKPITRRSNNPHLNKQTGRVDEAYRKRREYNNEAARRSRNNRRAQEIRTLEQTRRLTEENQRLLGQIDELRKQNNALDERNKELEKEKNQLRDILHRHNMSGSFSDI